MSTGPTPRIGIDLGGSKIQGVALDERGEVLASRRVAVPREDYPGTVTAIAEMVRALERSVEGTVRVGVGSPGSISPVTGRQRNSNAGWLIGEDLLGDLRRELGPSVRMANDANCFTLSEAQSDPAAGARVVAGIVLGTGVGSGLVIEGRVVTGRNRVGSELGHCSLPWPNADELPGPACYCGRRGCIETFLCGGALTRDYFATAGVRHEASEVAHLALQGDAAAVACLARYCDRLARSLALLVDILDPDLIVLGGGLANIAEIFEQAPRLLPSYIFSDAFETKILRSAYGDLSGARGAALLFASA